MEYATKTVVFVCTGNTCRSPMAAALFNWQAEKRGLDERARSAGVSALPGLTPVPYAVDTMAAYGLDISVHQSQPVTKDMFDNGYLCVAMERIHLPYLPTDAMTLGRLAGTGEDVPDPFGQSRAVYEACAKRINELIELWLDKEPFRGRKGSPPEHVTNPSD